MTANKFIENLKIFSLLIISSLIWSWFSMFNKFPAIRIETAGEIAQSLNWLEPYFYYDFIHILNNSSVFLIPLITGLIASYSIYISLKQISSRKNIIINFIITSLFLAIAPNFSLALNTYYPYVFYAISMISVINVILSFDKLSVMEKLFSIAVIFISSAYYRSVVVLFPLGFLCVSFLCFSILRNKRTLRNIFLVVIIYTLSMLCVMNRYHQYSNSYNFLEHKPI